ncbi:hypothetical protein Tco_0086352 [Tanacetum coccineum]
MFIKSRIYLDDEYVVMTCNYFLQYTQLEIPEFRDTLMQHMESVKKSIDERALHKRVLLGLKRLHGFLEVTAAQVHNGNYAKWFDKSE